MTAALSMMVIFVISFSFVRIASVAIRLTGLSDGEARFQALSALTGTGFTTSESELIVNYPIRRKIVTYLMIVGNLGLVSVMSTLMISLMRTDADVQSTMTQIALIVSGVGILFVLMTNKHVDELLCSAIAQLLKRYTFLGERSYNRLVQIGDGMSIAEHRIANGEQKTLNEIFRHFPSLTCLAITQSNGKTIMNPGEKQVFGVGDKFVVLGPDRYHEHLSAQIGETADL